MVEYRIYYRVNSATYNDSDFVTVSTTNPKFSSADPAWRFTLPDVDKEFCFMVTAIDSDGFESDFSNEVGGTTCVPKDYVGKRGGGGGIRRCFISTMKD